MLNQEQIKAKWKEIKGGVRNIWENVTDEELDQTKGNLRAVPQIVLEKYNESPDSVNEKLERLMESFDNDTDKGIDPDISSYQRNPTSERGQGSGEQDIDVSEIYEDDVRH